MVIANLFPASAAEKKFPVEIRRGMGKNEERRWSRSGRDTVPLLDRRCPWPQQFSILELCLNLEFTRLSSCSLPGHYG